jgi:ParB family chromosome partitioning protein
MSTKKSGLGKGLNAILSNSTGDATGKITAPVNNIAEIPISNIIANTFQPRTHFDEYELAELAKSIQLHGIIQPITVRKLGHDQFELISGERRTRAARLAGLSTIPAYVRIADDQAMLEMALIENIHRVDLNPIEISLSYKRLIEECSLTQEEVSERVGKKRTTVTNYLRLLKLPERIQLALKNNDITMGHARPLITIEDEEVQISVLEDILQGDYTVRQVEDLIKAYQKPSKKDENQTTKAKKEVKFDVEEWQRRFDTINTNKKVKISGKSNGKATVTLPIENETDLLKIYEWLESVSF